MKYGILISVFFFLQFSPYHYDCFLHFMLLKVFYTLFSVSFTVRWENKAVVTIVNVFAVAIWWSRGYHIAEIITSMFMIICIMVIIICIIIYSHKAVSTVFSTVFCILRIFKWSDLFSPASCSLDCFSFSLFVTRQSLHFYYLIRIKW